MVQRGYAPTPPSPPPKRPSPKMLEDLSTMLLRGENQAMRPEGPPPNVSPAFGDMRQSGVSAARSPPPLPANPVASVEQGPLPPPRYVSDALQQRLQQGGIPNLPTLGRGAPPIPLLKGGK